MSEDFAATEPSVSLRHGPRIPSAFSRLLSLVLARVTAGRLLIKLPSGESIDHRAPEPGPEAVLVITHWRALRRLVSRGDIGFAEGFIEGDWTSPDLVTLFQWTLYNEEALRPAWGGQVLGRFVDRILHLGRANTKRGSRRNIAAHYDLGNDFYAQWLDRGMSYSSAIYGDPALSLEDAQDAKISRVIELLDLSPHHSVLEIGCGWGALAERIAASTECALTGITLSAEQLAYTRTRLDASLPGTPVAIELKDYRDMEGQFDRLVSIEMIEAAGEEYWPAYFRKIRECLKPGGVAVLQAITIEEKRFEDYRRRPDFIQRYIFPGGMLPTAQIMRDRVAGEGLSLSHVELFGQSYAMTLAAWRERFLRAWPAMRGLGVVADEGFMRMWDYYLAYCEVGFRTGTLNVGLYQITKP